MRISDWSSDVCSSDLALVMTIVNAGKASYPKGWADYRACASYDRKTWFRVPTDYDGEVLTIRHTPAADSVYYAYFPPYSGERHRNLVARCQTAVRCRLEVLGRTLDGEDLALLVIGEPATIGRASCRERVVQDVEILVV